MARLRRTIRRTGRRSRRLRRTSKMTRRLRIAKNNLRPTRNWVRTVKALGSVTEKKIVNYSQGYNPNSDPPFSYAFVAGNNTLPYTNPHAALFHLGIDLAQGTGKEQRIGNKIFVRYLKGTLELANCYYQSTTVNMIPSNVVRVIFFWPKPGTVLNRNLFPNHTGQVVGSNFTVLKDYRINLGNALTPPLATVQNNQFNGTSLPSKKIISWRIKVMKSFEYKTNGESPFTQDSFPGIYIISDNTQANLQTTATGYKLNYFMTYQDI